MNGNWNPVVVVTGAASGIGRATTELIVERGGRVVAMDLAADALATLTALVSTDSIVPFVGDVTSEQANADAVALAEQTWGRLDVLVLNAGLRAAGPIDTADLDVFDRSMNVNLRSAVLGLRVGIPALRRKGGGSIVITASNSGLNGEVNRWQYAAAKAGVLNLMRSVAMDVAVDNIRVNAVCPGPTLTGMTSDLLVHAPARYESLRRTVPQQRWAEPREIAEAIWFLASPAASFITGAALPVDGGVSAHMGQGELPTR